MAFNFRFWKDNPQYFEPDGIWVFCGCQGSGKTLSAVQTVQKLHDMYPKAVIVSNVSITGIDTVPFTDYSQIERTKNDIYGVIFLIDEIQVLFNSLESKNIPLSEIACFCQNRKDRRVIIGTSQVYSRIAKPIREQLKYCILCNNVLKYIQVNTVIDPNVEGYSGEDNGNLEGAIVRREIWVHSPKNYLSYDTFKKIERIERKKTMGLISKK